jgi:hypothetical protein
MRINNKRLKLGNITADGATITADIVTVDNSLVQFLTGMEPKECRLLPRCTPFREQEERDRALASHTSVVSVLKVLNG